MEDVSKIIATINSNYAENPGDIKKVKELDEAIKIVKAKPLEEHKLVYDSPTEGMEPVYFWLLDYMSATAGKVEKIIDNFTSTPGSGHFGELGARKTQMQNTAMDIIGKINLIIKSIINIIYDLKEWQVLLRDYEAVKSKDKLEAEAGLLTLKQRWLDAVDIKKGNTSLKAMAGQFQFQLALDAFLKAKNVKNIDEIDLNDRVKRLVKPRIFEFLQWKDRSEQELKKRFEIEKTYMKSQVSTLKLYSRWLKPYLKAAAQLEMGDNGRNPDLVNAFSTSLFELTLLAKKEINFEQEIIDENLPESFDKKKLNRKYYSCVLVDFNHRGVPQRVSQQGHYSFGGKTEVSFKAFALNENELKKLNKKLEEQDINDVLKISAGIADESLAQIKDDINYYLEDDEEKRKEDKKKEKENDINPFSALFNIFKKDKKKEDKEGVIIKDSYVESVVRNLAEEQAVETCFDIFDKYKKAHQMPSPPPQFFG